jgi:cell division protein FtsN
MTQRGGTLLGIILGILAGVLISFGVVWYLQKPPLPLGEEVPRPGPAREHNNGGNSGKPAALPGKPGDKPIDKNKGGEKKFEFYDILEGKKQPTPGAVTAEKQDAAPASEASGSSMYLQVGAFQKKADADNLRARLAMLGFEAGVVAGEVPDKGTMHRVRVGPFGSPEEMNRARTQLSQNGVPATLVRGK